MWDVSRDDEHTMPLLERAIAALGDKDSALLVRLLARLAGGPLRDSSFPPERRAEMSSEALGMARRLDDPPTLAYAIQGYILGHHSPDHVRRQLQLATELVDVAGRAGDKERVLEGHEERFDSWLELGESAAAKADLAAMDKLADELRQPSHRWLAGVQHTLLALLEGRFADAERLLAPTRALGERAQSWSATVTYRLQLYVLRREQGRLDEIAGLVRRWAEEYPTYPIWRCVLAHTAAEVGDTQQARAALESIAAGDFSNVPFDEEWLVSMSLLAETASKLSDTEHAPALYERLLPYRDRVAVSYPEISIGAVERYLGLLATTMRRWDDAERHFEGALELNARVGARPWVAHTSADHGRMLLARARAEDRPRALEMLERAQAAYRDLAMESHAMLVRSAPAAP
jgi:tetratricopeptide (TPR) repeat protein